MEDDFLTGPLACCSVLRVNAPVQPRRPSTLTLVLIRRWTHLIPHLTPHSPFVPATSCPDPNIDPQVDQAYFAPHPPRLPHGFNYDISKTSLLYRLSLICFWHLRTLSKNRTNERTNEPVLCKIRRDPAVTGLHVPGSREESKVAAFADDDDDDELMLNVLRCHETY